MRNSSKPRNFSPACALAASTVLAAILLAPVPAGADAVPQEKRIPARIETTLTIPAGQQPMLMPTAVAVDSKSNVFVADGANGRIVRFDRGGKMLDPWSPGLSRPTGLTVDSSDRLWIADSGNHRIVRLNEQGAIAEAIDLPGNQNTPAKPTDLLVTPDLSRIYIVDNDDHRLIVREQATGKWTFLGSAGKALGQFQYPFMLARGSEGDILITEVIGARVQVLTRDDKWAGQVGKFGVKLGQLYRPKGIAADRSGRIFVSDSTLDVVQVFSPGGQLEGVLTDDAGQLVRFEHPMGMTFDAAGRLYVVELKAGRVAIVKLRSKAEK